MLEALCCRGQTSSGQNKCLRYNKTKFKWSKCILKIKSGIIKAMCSPIKWVQLKQYSLHWQFCFCFEADGYGRPLNLTAHNSAHMVLIKVINKVLNTDEVNGFV